MPDNLTIASPLGTPTAQRVEGAGLTLTERRDVGMLLIRGVATNEEFVTYFEELLGVKPPEGRSAVAAGAFSIVRMGRTDYLISGDLEAVEALSRKAEASAEGVPCIAAEITHGRIIVDMEGKGALTVLSKSCGLDTRPAVFPVGLGTRTRFADGLAYIERLGEDHFRLVTDRSVGQYFWAWLKDAGDEFLT